MGMILHTTGRVCETELVVILLDYALRISLGTFSILLIHDPGVVVAGGICPVRTCLVLRSFFFVRTE